MESLVLSCRGKKAVDEGQREGGGGGQRCPPPGQGQLQMLPLCLGHRLQLLPCGGGADEETIDDDEKMLDDRGGAKHPHPHHHHLQQQLQHHHQQQQHLGYLSKRKICRFELNEHYVVLRHIGSGTFGNVLLALCIKDQEKVRFNRSIDRSLDQSVD